MKDEATELEDRFMETLSDCFTTYSCAWAILFKTLFAPLPKTIYPSKIYSNQHKSLTLDYLSVYSSARILPVVTVRYQLK